MYILVAEVSIVATKDASATPPSLRLRRRPVVGDVLHVPGQSPLCGKAQVGTQILRFATVPFALA